MADIEQDYDDFLVLYLRLLHDYEKLRSRYEHARAAIDNDLWIDVQLRCPF